MSAAKIWINLPKGATHVSESGVFYKEVKCDEGYVWFYWSSSSKMWVPSYSTLQLEVL